MAIDKRTLAVLDGSGGAFSDRVILGMQLAVANAAGAGNGAAVTTTVTFKEGIPSPFTVLIEPNQAATAYVTNKTTNGFDVVLTPPAANTLAAGAFDVIVLA